MPFSPEQFMAPENEAFPWAQLASQTSGRQQDAIRAHRTEREQKRQFDEQQQRLLANDAEQKRQFGQTLEQQQQTLKYQVWKEANEKEWKRQQDLQEGMEILDKAWVESELVEDYDTAVDMAAGVYGLVVVPKGTIPPGLAPHVAAQAEAETEEEFGPPPDAPAGALPPGQAPAPAGAAPAPALAPGQAPAPAGAAPTPELAPGQAPAPAGAQPQAPAAPGQAPAPAGAAPAPALAPGQAPAPVTTAATEVAATEGANHLGKTGGKVPAVPETAATAEEAAKADKENPWVSPPQDMPPASLAQYEQKLRDMKPATALELESRTSTDAQRAASYQKRIEALKTMGLSPTAFAIAANFAARSHGMPAVAVPPGPAADPNAPPDAQGPGEWNVELPPGVKEFAEAPPDVTPSALRDGIESGGHDIYDMHTGKKLATRDFAAIQEKRIDKRRKEIAPIMKGLGSTKEEQSRINAVAESYIVSGDKKYLDILQSVLRINAAAEFRGETQRRADETQFVNVTKEMQAQADKIVTDAHANEKLTDMKKVIADTNNTLKILRSNPGAIQQRKVMTDLLKAAHNGRATDRDAEMSFRAGLWNDVEKLWGYLDKGGELPPNFMKQLEDVIVDINKGERRKQIIVAEGLAAQVYENFYMQSVAPQASEWQARYILRKAFPEMSKELINQLVEEAAKNAPPLGAAAVGYGQTPRSTSNSTGATVIVRGPKVEGETAKPKPKGKGKGKGMDVNKYRGLGGAAPATPAAPAAPKGP